MKDPKRKRAKGAKPRRDDDKLCPAHERFCKEYALLGGGHGSGAAAIRKAYPQVRTKSDQYISQRASILLATDTIQKRIAELRGQIVQIAHDKFNISAEEILQRLAAIGYSSIEEFVEVDAKGLPKISFAKASKGAIRGLHGIKVKQTSIIKLTDAAKMLRDRVSDIDGPELETSDDDLEKVTETEIEIKFPGDRVSALHKLGQHVGLFGKDEGTTINITLDERLRKAIAKRREAHAASAAP
jgi:Terminase small subunit